MYLNIDFYSKLEVSVDQNLNGSYAGQGEEFSSLMLFTTFLTRIYSNFGAQPVGKILSVILRHLTLDDYVKLIDRKYSFPDIKQLGGFLQEDHIDPGVDLNVFEKMIFQPMPNAVPPRKPLGKYGFHLTLSPCKLDLEGFSMFSRDLNYYSFQSIFALIPSFGRYYQSVGWPINSIGHVAKILSTYYQQQGTAHFRKAEEFAFIFIVTQIYNVSL